MENFEYHTPTRLIFGKGIIDRLPEVMRPIGNKVLLAYGGGSIKRLGLYDKVKELLKDFEIHELGGIEPNPKYNPSVLDGQRICKEKRIDVILSVGGGSVLDCCKAIAAAARYEGDPWDLISYKVKAEDALPIVDVMTLAATGSEYDCGGVISRTETARKKKSERSSLRSRSCLPSGWIPEAESFRCRRSRKRTGRIPGKSISFRRRYRRI